MIHDLPSMVGAWLLLAQAKNLGMLGTIPGRVTREPLFASTERTES
jgi:hypothetical protein